ncbi:hypothetical protein [Marinicrinis lubricantis]|uniref:Uncharacterized protein n=1 Tax=Marinicrinis lubricantis TaxID=2086470 RepID=A0ABW1INS8_9BACL
MIKVNDVLRTDADFENAILFKNRVAVTQYGFTVDYGGMIESFDKEYVKINNRYYQRASYEFRVR